MTTDRDNNRTVLTRDTHLPHLFRYATSRHDAATTPEEARRWAHARRLTASLIATLNDTDLSHEHHHDPKPTPPEITFVSPREKLTEVLHDLMFLRTILSGLIANARTRQTTEIWLNTRATAYLLQSAIAEALQAEKLDDALEGVGPDDEEAQP